MKKILLLSLFILGFTCVKAQDFELKKEYRFKTKADYKKYEPDIKQAIEWLEQTPPNEQVNKRDLVKALLLKWLTGSPSVSITISEDVVTFMKCAECLIVFMGGWTKHALANNSKNQLQGNLAGIEAVIKFYQKNKPILGKNRAIEKYMRLKKKNKLEKRVRSKLK